MSIQRVQRLLCERTQEFRVLQQIIEAVGSTLELPVVFDEILRLVSEVTAADACLLYLLDDATATLVLEASKPPHPDSVGRIALQVGEGLTGWVAQERRPIVIARHAFDDPRFKAFQQLPEDRYEAFLSVPMTTRDRLVGVINIQHRKPHRYGAESVAMAELIGRLVGGAIANARLHRSVQQHRRELRTLAQVSEVVVSEQYLDEILQLIVTVTAELMHSKICSLMLLDDAKQELVIKATQALSPAYRNKPPIKVGQSISGKAVKERGPITVLDVANDRGYMFPELAKREGLCSLLCVPMIAKDQVIGVLNCYTSQPHRFSNDEVRALSTIANQAAAAIERTRLLDEAVTAREALETRKLVERAKGILMAEARLTEAQAFRALQQQSMQKRKSMRDIAEAIVLSREIAPAMTGTR